jgi:TRIAD3 protein (E3 ubiquitin-protein ligase RNF216)
MAVQQILDNWDGGKRPFELNKRARETTNFAEETVNAKINAATPFGERLALEELQAARAMLRVREAQNHSVQQRLKEEEANLEAARAEGTIVDCGCCCSEYAQNRMIYCNAEDPHVGFILEGKSGLSHQGPSC